MFYIVSRGSTATHWLSKNISKHKDLVCFYSSRSFPPVEPGKGYPNDKNSWVKDNLDAEKYIDSLLKCEEATHNSKVFGSIHGYRTLNMKDLVEKRNGVFKYMVRNPLEMVHSAFIIYTYRYLGQTNLKISNKDIHKYVCENLKDLKTKKNHFELINDSNPHYLRNYLSEKNFLFLKKTKNYFKNIFSSSSDKKNVWGYEKDTGNINENILLIFARICRGFLHLQNQYFSNWGPEKAIIMEKIFNDKNYYKKLILDLAPGREVSDNYLNEIFNSIEERVNIHREKPLKFKEIYKEMPLCMHEIFNHFFETYNIQRICDKFEYEQKL